MEVKIDNSFKPNYSDLLDGLKPFKDDFTLSNLGPCLLYTSDAADE